MKTQNPLRVIQPQPFRTLDQDGDDPGAVRRHDCRHYDRCNHIAVVGRWPGFTCAACLAFKEQAPEAKERDARAAIRAAAELLGFRTDVEAPPTSNDAESASIATIKWAA